MTPEASPQGAARRGHGNMREAAQRVCACGCGVVFQPVKAWQKFVGRKHADEYHTRLTAKARALVKEMRARDARERTSG